MKLIKHLHNLSCAPGILVLENKKNKRVLLIRSSDSLGSLSRILKATKSRNKRWKLLRKDYRKLDIKIVSEDNSRISFQYWVNFYTSLGYDFYRTYKAIQYEVKIDVLPEEKDFPHQYDVLVKLVSRNRRETVVGVFSTMEEGQKFIELYYKDEVITQVVYSTNERSKRYFENEKK